MVCALASKMSGSTRSVCTAPINQTWWSNGRRLQIADWYQAKSSRIETKRINDSQSAGLVQHTGTVGVANFYVESQPVLGSFHCCKKYVFTCVTDNWDVDLGIILQEEAMEFVEILVLFRENLPLQQTSDDWSKSRGTYDLPSVLTSKLLIVTIRFLPTIHIWQRE